MTSLTNLDFSNDEFLLHQVEQGNKQSFNLLFEKYWGKAYADAYKRLKDSDQAKDIVQEIFTHIWLNRATLHILNLPAYLNTAVRNRVIKIVARQKLTHPFFSVLENMPEKVFQADSSLLWKEFYKAYEELVTTFPPKRQLIFRLRFQNDLPTKDIAQQLGLSRKTVQNQLGKAIEKLKVSLLPLSILVISFLPGLFGK
jgi:RNA polymerase sigma-70 factor (ECF subfamily)